MSTYSERRTFYISQQQAGTYPNFNQAIESLNAVEQTVGQFFQRHSHSLLSYRDDYRMWELGTEDTGVLVSAMITGSLGRMVNLLNIVSGDRGNFEFVRAFFLQGKKSQEEVYYAQLSRRDLEKMAPLSAFNLVCEHIKLASRF